MKWNNLHYYLTCDIMFGVGQAWNAKRCTSAMLIELNARATNEATKWLSVCIAATVSTETKTQNPLSHHIIHIINNCCHSGICVRAFMWYASNMHSPSSFRWRNENAYDNEFMLRTHRRTYIFYAIISFYARSPRDNKNKTKKKSIEIENVWKNGIDGRGDGGIALRSTKHSTFSATCLLGRSQ